MSLKMAVLMTVVAIVGAISNFKGLQIYAAPATNANSAHQVGGELVLPGSNRSCGVSDLISCQNKLLDCIGKPSFASATRLPSLVPDFQVNENGGRAEHQEPVATALPNGYVVAWQDYRNGEGDIYAQLFDQNGNQVGANFCVHSQENSFLQFSPNISADKEGNFAVTWSETNFFEQWAMVQFFDRNGGKRGGVVPLDDVDIGASGSGVYFDNVDKFILIWRVYAQDGIILKQARFSSSGEQIGVTVQVNEPAPGLVSGVNEKVGISSVGDYGVMWIAQEGLWSRIVLQCYDREGRPNGGNRILWQGQNNSVREPELAVNKNGKYLIAWHGVFDNREAIVSRIYDANADSVHDLVNQSEPNASFSTDIILPVAETDDSFSLFWTNNSATPRLLHRAISTDGTNSSSIDTLALFENLDYILTRMQRTESGLYLFGQFRDPSTRLYIFRGFYRGTDGRLSELQVNDTPVRDILDKYVILPIANNDVRLFWPENRLGYSDIYSQLFRDGEKTGANSTFTDDSNCGTRHSPTIVSVANGDFFVFWYDPMDFGNVWMKRFTGSGEPVGTAEAVVENRGEAPNLDYRILTDEQNFVLVYWSDTVNGQGQYFCQFYNMTGEKQSGNIQLTQNDLILTSWPHIGAAVNDDKIFLAWATFNKINGQLFSLHGEPLGDAFAVSEPERLPELPTVVAIGSDFLVQWVARGSTNAQYIKAQLVTQDGQLSGDVFTLNDHQNTLINFNSLTPTSGDFAFSLWSDTAGVSGRFINPKSATLSEPFFFREPFAWNCFVVPLNATDAAIVWQGAISEDNTIFAQRVTSGGLQGEKLLINDATADAPVVLLDVSYQDGGDFVVCWQARTANSWDVFGRYVDGNLSPGVNTFRIPATQERIQGDAAVFFRGDNLYSIWIDNHVLNTGSNVWANVLTVDKTTGIKTIQPVTNFALYENYPNPFNPTTTIRYSLPHTMHVTIEVFDTLGRRVLEPVDGEKNAGVHTVQVDGRMLASGVYLYRMTAGAFSATHKMLLIK